MTTGAIILAAGQSRRFGAQDKLLAPLNGGPLVAAALSLVRRDDLACSIAVVSSPAVAAMARGCGVEVLLIDPGLPQSLSLIQGMEAMERLGVTRLLVLLGDMPFVRPDHVSAILAMPKAQVACAFSGGVAMPPAVFPVEWFARIRLLTGDRGAGSLLRDLPADCHVPLPEWALRDIDLPSDLTEG